MYTLLQLAVVQDVWRGAVVQKLVGKLVVRRAGMLIQPVQDRAGLIAHWSQFMWPVQLSSLRTLRHAYREKRPQKSRIFSPTRKMASKKSRWHATCDRSRPGRGMILGRFQAVGLAQPSNASSSISVNHAGISGRAGTCGSARRGVNLCRTRAALRHGARKYKKPEAPARPPGNLMPFVMPGRGAAATARHARL